MADWFDDQGAPGGGGGAGSGDDWFAQQGGGLGGAPGGAPPPGGAPATGNPTDRNFVRSQLANWYASQGLTPTGPGTGPTDIEYYTDKILETGGWTNQTGKGEQNIDYWTRRIPQDIAEARGGGAAGGAGGAGGMLGALQTSPGYQFRLGEGLKAIERGAAAKGTLLTGGTLKGLTRYGQDYASNEYNNRYNQLLGLTNIGANAAAGQANANSAYGTAASDLTTQGGNAAAAGTIGGANAYQGAINTGTNLAQQYYLARLYGMTPGGGGGTAPPPGGVGPYRTGYQFPTMPGGTPPYALT